MKNLGFIIPLLLLLLIDIYVFQAFRTVTASFQAPTRQLIAVVFWMLAFACYAYLVFFWLTGFESEYVAIRKMGGVMLMILVVSKLVVIPFLLIEDISRFVRWLWDFATQAFGSDKSQLRVASRAKFISQLALIVGSIPLVSLVYGMLANTYNYQIRRVKLALNHLPASFNGLKIVQISDIHIGSLKDKAKLQAGIDMINNEKADLVFFTGDMVNSKADEMEPYADIFGRIKAKKGVYSVMGNHDYGDYYHWPSKFERQKNLEALHRTHSGMGWNLLLNENKIIKNEDGKLAIIGVENWSAKRHFRRYGDLSKAFKGAELADVKLLLSHDPSHWDAEITKTYSDIDITFSGHTHGMQFGIEIPGWIEWSPIKYVYKQWAGLYQKGKQYLYVNRGFGVLGYPGRVGILPEITVVELETA